MAADLFDPDAFTAALDGDAPCGPDLEYDPAFQALNDAAAGKPERQYGDKVYPAEPPDWLTVYEQALDLAARTRDLRVGVWLTRSAARLHGMAGAVAGLRLVRALLETHWDALHPQLDAEDDNDPTMRLNALLPLYANDGALADLRNAALAPVRGGLRLRELELGLGRDEPTEGETQPTEGGVLEGLQALVERHPDTGEKITQAAEAAQAIAGVVESAVGSRAPDSAPLLRLLAAGTDALAKLQGDAGGEAAADGDEEAGAGTDHSDGDDAAPRRGGRGGGAIRSRADAVRELQRVCDWIERNEPTNPAPLLIKRAQRLMNMSFLEIVREMAPAGVDQVETIAGPQTDS
jgi:type VI secretion system protein ImpA